MFLSLQDKFIVTNFQSFTVDKNASPATMRMIYCKIFNYIYIYINRLKTKSFSRHT